jgi:CRP/FNR family transcriptional regulator, cyclic AMP receptor protein
MSLERIPFFKDASIDLKALEARCRWKKFIEGEVLIDFEDDTHDVYFIASGSVQILVRTQSGKEIIFCDMHQGQFLGELAAIDGEKRSANVTALTNCDILIVPAKVFMEIVTHTPSLAHRLLTLLTKRVRDLNWQLVKSTVLDVRHRLYDELLRLSVVRKGNHEQRVVSPPPYHHILASRIGCRREQITRELSEMKKEGLLEKTRGSYVLLNPTLLEERIAKAFRDEG